MIIGICEVNFVKFSLDKMIMIVVKINESDSVGLVFWLVVIFVIINIFVLMIVLILSMIKLDVFSFFFILFVWLRLIFFLWNKFIEVFFYFRLENSD